jgi:hypothetical protein
MTRTSFVTIERYRVACKKGGKEMARKEPRSNIGDLHVGANSHLKKKRGGDNG